MVLLLVILFALLHTPYVQERVAQYVLSSVIAKTDGKLRVGKASFDIYKGVRLESLELTDAFQDTLLTIGQLGLNPRNTLISFISGDLKVNDITISDVFIKVEKKAGEDSSNWAGFISAFTTNSESKARSPRSGFDLSQMVLSHVHLIYHDEVTGVDLNASFNRWELEIDQWSFTDTVSMSIARWVLNEPEVHVHRKIQNIKTTSPEAYEKQAIAPAMDLIIRNFDIVNGNFTLVEESDEVVRNREFSDLDLGLSNLVYQNQNNWTVRVDEVSGQADEGLINHLGIARLSKVNDKIAVNSAFLRTPGSLVKLDAEVTDIPDITDWSTYNLNVKVASSVVRLSDLFGIIPALRDEFQHEVIATRPIQLKGNYLIGKDAIDGKNIDIWINGKHHFVGDGMIANLSSSAPLSLDVHVRDLKTDVSDLSKLYSKIPVIEELNRMGTVFFVGDFKGLSEGLYGVGLAEV